MNYGISKSDFEILQNVIINRLKKHSAEVWIFGSRARGDHQKFSDVDLLYSMPSPINLPPGFISEIIEDIENSNFPYKVDLVNTNDLAESYRPSILKDRVKL